MCGNLLAYLRGINVQILIRILIQIQYVKYEKAVSQTLKYRSKIYSLAIIYAN